jgi:DHA2 family multidrug resistance protein
MDSSLVVSMGLLQGIGIGLVFVPLTTLGFATLDVRYRADGAGVFTLMRNLGASVGISIMQALLTQNGAKVYSRLMSGVTPDNPNWPLAMKAGGYSLTNPAGIATLGGEVTRQSSMVAYVDDFKMMFILGMAVLPLLFFMRPPRKGDGGAPHVAME